MKRVYMHVGEVELTQVDWDGLYDRGEKLDVEVRRWEDRKNRTTVISIDLMAVPE